MNKKIDPIEDMDMDMDMELDDTEISIEDVDINIVNETISDNSTSDDIVEGDIVLSKHSQNGKHSLKYDVIFKGKKENKDEEDFDDIDTSLNQNFTVDRSTILWEESMNNENYIRDKRVKEKVYDIIVNYTTIDISSNRRKPSKTDFNKYYYILKTHLKDENFSNTEIFNELSVYFSENLFNMFKLLDNKWKNDIIAELAIHIGKNDGNKEVINRNLKKDTEVEFKYLDPIDNDLKIINGIIKEVDYDDSIFTIDSFERIYDIHISDITKILSNNRYKYNLNKLLNVDFL